ncbi:hypothetical protein [Flavobacterium chungnamense]|uniref:Cthe-2314-like HEPN domain-containing protein n=1 Tax=Flavobacterium chungnamense TaxID=706182 RepID=A0ABP7V4T7_9FLAO
MAKYSKESLEKLLLLIDEICSQEENLWFRERLESKFSIKSNLNNPDIVNKLNAIQKYLMIDGVEVIDYSEIKNENVRNQLYRDCIEMSKYRLGKINNTINFDEYCRYAHMQAEELLNFFYITKHVDLSKVVEILKINADYTPSSLPKNIHSIPYSYKLNAFIKLNGLDYKLKYYLDFISKLRNEISHRNSLQINNEDSILATASLKKFNLEGYQELNEFEKHEQNIYFKAKFIHERRKQDFKSIMIYLDYLKQAIIILIK